MSSTNSVMFFTVLILIQHHGYNADCYENNKNYQKIWKSVKETVSEASENGMLAFGLKTAAIATATIVAAPVVVGAAGFGATGIAAGSVAAAVQASWFGGVISGTTGVAFGALQSIGAAGLGIGAKSLVVTASGAAVKAYEYMSGDSEGDENGACSAKSPDNDKRC